MKFVEALEDILTMVTKGWSVNCLDHKKQSTRTINKINLREVGSTNNSKRKLKIKLYLLQVSSNKK